MDILINTSLLTAFFAGVAALMAPCCITVLLPAYFASIFRQKTKVFFMTFVFFLGVLIIFLPLGLGFGGIGRLFARAHDLVFFFGGVFMLLLAGTMFFGFHPRLPFNFSQKTAGQHIPSIFILGIFSGLATTCCAPVLAGVLALSVLPGSVFWGGMYSLIYVLGMVLPLFFIALFLDKVNLTEKFQFFKKPIRYKILSKDVILPLANFFSGLMFFAMGVLILYLSLTGGLRMESDFLVKVNILTAKYLNSIEGVIKSIPEFVLPVFFVLLFFGILWIALKQIKRR